ncbi:GNAT family N-acetyltransferase [Eisenbergiella sp.]
MEIVYREATKSDIETLINLRLEYLISDRGSLSEKEKKQITDQLINYLGRNIDETFTAILAEINGEIVSTAYLSISEKPANPSFITGKIGTILNVYTKPQFRKQGISTKVLAMLIDKAKKYNISKIELSATEMGKSLYERLGFREKQSKYTNMQLYI